MSTRPILLSALALALLASPPPARGATFEANVGYDALDADGVAPCDLDPDAPGIDYRPNDPDNALARPCSLRAAVVLANLTPEADTINIDFNPMIGGTRSTFALSLTGAGEDAGLTGDLDITTPISIVGEGVSGGFDRTFIDAKRLKDRVFDVRPGGSLELRRASLVNGKTGSADPGGGCIRSAGALGLGSVFFYRCSAAGEGGCLSVVGGTASAGDSTFSTCKAKGEGGGLAVVSGSATLFNVTFGRNRAAAGGAVASRGDLVLRNATLDGNQAKLGGGLAALGAGATTLNNCTISENGKVNVDASQNTGTLAVSNSIVWGAKTDCVGTVPTAGGNLEGATSCGFTGTNDQQSQDPLLAPLNFYSDLIATRTLGRFVNEDGITITSPAVDHAQDAGAPAPCETTDARNLGRVDIDGDSVGVPGTECDSGASELSGS